MIGHSRKFGAAIALSLIGASAASAQQQTRPAPPPLPYRVLKELQKDPAKWAEFLARHEMPTPAPEPLSAPPGVLGWKSFPTAPSGDPLSNPLLLTDGSIIAHVTCTGRWYRLAPDIDGNYATSAWKAIASLPAGYAPRFFGSAVLQDGRVIIEGGEYNTTSCKDVETNRGAIYDPENNAWTAVAPPKGWSEIGDAESIVLPNQTYLLSSAATIDLATLNLSSLTWTSFLPSGKSDSNNEENWTLLPDGDVLTVEAYTQSPSCLSGTATYLPGSRTWMNSGSTPQRLSGCAGSIQNFEAPTQVLQPSGDVIAFGATASLPKQNFPVYTAIFNTSTKKWSSGPDMPKVDGVYYTMADAPASILPDGSAMIAASPGEWKNASDHGYPSPTHIFRYYQSAFTQLGDIANASVISSYEVNMLVLPTGDILAVETDYANNNLFPASTDFPRLPAYAPIISSAPQTVSPGATYTLSGNQISGLTQGAVYGDDCQADTNFPLVRIVNNATGHVFYAKTTNFSRTIAPDAPSATDFTVSSSTEEGASELYVVVNGIASTAWPVTVN